MYSDKSRPPPLSSKHVTGYIARVESGGAIVDYDPHQGSVPPSPVPSYHSGGRPGSAGMGDGEIPGMGGDGTPAADGTPLSGTTMLSMTGPDSWRLFYEGQDPARAITVDVDNLDFGSCSRLSAAEYKAVVVSNNTDIKVTAFIQVPVWQDPQGGEPKPIFQVCDVSRMLAWSVVLCSWVT